MELDVLMHLNGIYWFHRHPLQNTQLHTFHLQVEQHVFYVLAHTYGCIASFDG